MKPHTEMHEGPKALRRFEDTMKSLFSARKPDISDVKQKAQKASVGTRPTKAKKR